MYQLRNFDVEIFLRDYWQQKPCVIKQGFVDFIDPLDQHDLAGLAQEQDIDSRIVSHEQEWQVSHGPFDEFAEACLGAWTLLVQSVDHYLPQAEQLMQAFDFIPKWRTDDLMVSFSNQGGGVGPHLDQYDVFIVQGTGTRRWQVGALGTHATTCPHPELKQVAPFEPIIDQVLTSGDIIYIPPGFPHNGVALEDCLNYSIGFRAPSQQELLSDFADYAIDEGLLTSRYRDKKIVSRFFSGEIKQDELKAFKALMHEAIDSEHINPWLAKFLSRSHQALAFDSRNYSEQEIARFIEENTVFIRQLGLKICRFEPPGSKSQELTYYIDGQDFTVPIAEQSLVDEFLSAATWENSVGDTNPNSPFFTSFLTALVNQGYWYLD